MTPILTTLLSLLAMLAFASVLEYSVHRWRMHRRGDWYFQSHAVEHHGRGRQDREHMSFTASQAIVAWAWTLPLWLTPVAFGYWQGLLWPAFLAWWYFAWRSLHWAAHGVVSPHLPLLVPWWKWGVRHHRGHHRHPSTNFGALFPWTDYLFGTALKSG